jgi:Glyoxalase-like domain
VAFADVEDLDAARETLLAAGATERDAPRQVAPGTRICVLADPDGKPDRPARRVADAWRYRGRRWASASGLGACLVDVSDTGLQLARR